MDQLSRGSRSTCMMRERDRNQVHLPGKAKGSAKEGKVRYVVQVTKELQQIHYTGMLLQHKCIKSVCCKPMKSFCI